MINVLPLLDISATFSVLFIYHCKGCTFHGELPQILEGKIMWTTNFYHSLVIKHLLKKCDCCNFVWATVFKDSESECSYCIKYKSNHQCEPLNISTCT